MTLVGLTEGAVRISRRKMTRTSSRGTGSAKAAGKRLAETQLTDCAPPDSDTLTPAHTTSPEVVPIRGFFNLTARTGRSLPLELRVSGEHENAHRILIPLFCGRPTLRSDIT